MQAKIVRGTVPPLPGLRPGTPAVPVPPHRPGRPGDRGRDAQPLSYGPGSPSRLPGSAACRPGSPRRVDPAHVEGPPGSVPCPARGDAPLASRPGLSPLDVSSEGRPGLAGSSDGTGPVGGAVGQGEPDLGYRGIHGELATVSVALAPSSVWGIGPSLRRGTGFMATSGRSRCRPRVCGPARCGSPSGTCAWSN